MTEYCEKTDLPVGTCGGTCCRPDLADALSNKDEFDELLERLGKNLNQGNQ